MHFLPFFLGVLKNVAIRMDGNLCYKNTGTEVMFQSQEIRCNPPAVGSVLKIQLMDSPAALTLCEVSVKAFQYAGRYFFLIVLRSIFEYIQSKVGGMCYQERGNMKTAVKTRTGTLIKC
jgi:hypothetical protein